jgi:lysophospholipase L1-like esterase
MKALVDADIAARPEEIITALLFNLGVNDVNLGIPAQAAWESNAGYILDAFHTRWPGIKVYMMKVWYRAGAPAQADLDTLNTWIDNVVGARAGWAFVGPNEQVWLEGGDDGATMTYDGVHYSAAGNAECAAQWKTALGY